MSEYVLGTVDEFPEGARRAFKAGARTVAVFRSNGEFFALANRCVHKGASMCEGELSSDGQKVRCPWHNWPFDLRTGRNTIDPRERLRTFGIKVEGGEVILLI